MFSKTQVLKMLAAFLVKPKRSKAKKRKPKNAFRYPKGWGAAKMTSRKFASPSSGGMARAVSALKRKVARNRAAELAEMRRFSKLSGH